MTEEAAVTVPEKYLLQPYLDWTKQEGIPTHQGLSVDLIAADNGRWDRYDAKGSFIHITGRGDFVSTYALELVPGRSCSPQRHLFEEVVYVIEGHGSTSVEMPSGGKATFEWGPKSLFSLPLNARYRHFNASGVKRALLACTHTLPIMMNLLHNATFIFENTFTFADRFGPEKHFNGDGDYIAYRPGRNMWETNFVSDLAGFNLTTWNARGAGSSNICFILSDGTMHAHCSEIPVARYKKAHRHGPGYHIFAVTGTGYTLLWHEGEEDFQTVPWRHGILYAPPARMFHQHFNTGHSPARYLAVAIGSRRYPFTEENRVETDRGSDTSLKQGGIQVEYEDQDPRIHQLWLREIAKNGVRSDMGVVIDESQFSAPVM